MYYNSNNNIVCITSKQYTTLVEGGVTMCNNDIRNALNQNNIKHWQLADLLKISEATLTRRMRHELPQEEKQRIFNILHNLQRKEV